jgi:hypothetical protein
LVDLVAVPRCIHALVSLERSDVTPRRMVARTDRRLELTTLRSTRALSATFTRAQKWLLNCAFVAHPSCLAFTGRHPIRDQSVTKPRQSRVTIWRSPEPTPGLPPPVSCSATFAGQTQPWCCVGSHRLERASRVHRIVAGQRGCRGPRHRDLGTNGAQRARSGGRVALRLAVAARVTSPILLSRLGASTTSPDCALNPVVDMFSGPVFVGMRPAFGACRLVADGRPDHRDRAPRDRRLGEGRPVMSAARAEASAQAASGEVLSLVAPDGDDIERRRRLAGGGARRARGRGAVSFANSRPRTTSPTCTPRRRHVHNARSLTTLGNPRVRSRECPE